MTMLRSFAAIFCLFVGWFSSQAQDDAYLPVVEDVLLVNPSYVVDFDASANVANWVAYELKSVELRGGQDRSDNFRFDPRVPGSPTQTDYRGTGYDRGHLKPAADSKSSAAEMSNSFFMTNMAPQTPGLNRGIWKDLEADVRTWAEDFGRIYVLTGPSDEAIGRLPSGVEVPSHFWKAVLRLSPDTAAVAFWLPNSTSIPGSLDNYRLSIDALEALLALDLFAQLPDATEGRVEAETRSHWDTSGAVRPPVSSGSSASSGASQQCTGMAKSTGQRCKLMTKDPSGRCHHHRD
jgi:endonuclease G